MREIIVMASVLILILSVSGCISDACQSVENELANQNVTCKCSSSDVGNVFPDEAKNATEGEKCYCVCFKDGLTIKAVTPKPNDTLSEGFFPR